MEEQSPQFIQVEKVGLVARYIIRCYAGLLPDARFPGIGQSAAVRY
jgi:hypothetical protein